MLQRPTHEGVCERFEAKNTKFLPCGLIFGISAFVDAGTWLKRFLEVHILMILAASVNQFVHNGCDSAIMTVQRNRRGRAHVCTWTRVFRRYKTVQGKHTVL